MSAILERADERTEPGSDAPAGAARERGYVNAIGYLRAWITVLVVGHHAVLAYHPFAPPVAKSMVTPPHVWGAFPVVDSARWSGFTLFVSSNEMFFMALMFLLSGLFVWPSLERKGAGGYLRDRVLRLGLPFAIASAVLAPIAYYPAFLQIGGTGGLAGFWRAWTTPGVWMSGPAWFLWVLLAFDVVVAAAYRAASGWGPALGSAIARMRRPAAVFGALFAVSALAYLALEMPIGGMNWWTWGPFTVQPARILHYFAYFVFGVGAGACGLDRTVFAPGGALARQWKRWLAIAAAAFVAAMVVIIMALGAKPLGTALHVGANLAYTLSSAASSFAAIALFLHFGRKPSAVFAALAPCAYGMYLVHYPIVNWLQYTLLGAPLPGFLKGVIVFGAAVSISWGLVAMLRRIPAVARVV